MSTRLFPAFCLAIVIGGCTSIEYKIPAGSPTARLTLQNTVGPGEIGMVSHQKVDCRDAGKLVPTSKLKPGASNTMEIEAGRPFTFVVQSYRPVSGNNADVVAGGLALNVCEAAGTFTPDTGAEYVVMFRDENNLCSVSVHDARSTQPLSGFVQKKWYSSTFSEGWHCRS